MTRIERIAQELQRRIKANNFKQIAITMKCNGDVLIIRPCSMFADIESFDQIQYYAVESPSLPWLGSQDIMLIAKDLDNYENLIKERDREIDNLKAHIREHGYLDDEGYVDGWVSDYYKDLFGRRPHMTEAEAMAWASR